MLHKLRGLRLKVGGALSDSSWVFLFPRPRTYPVVWHSKLCRGSRKFQALPPRRTRDFGDAEKRSELYAQGSRRLSTSFDFISTV